MNWDDKGAHGGVAHGRPVDRKRARLQGTSVHWTKPIIWSPKEHANFEAHAAEGIILAT